MSRIWELPVEFTKLTFDEQCEVWLQYVAKQAGDCVHCGKSLYGPPSKEVRTTRIPRELLQGRPDYHPANVYTNPHTGLTIGAAHARCIVLLGYLHPK